MLKTSEKILIVVPCFNEEARLRLTYWEDVIAISQQVSWLFVDDGSTDRTKETITYLQKFQNVEFYSLGQNQGKAEAIRVGLSSKLNSQFKVFGYLDADCAFLKEDIFNLISLFCAKIDTDEELDCLIGSRVKLSGRDINRSPMRHYISRILLTVINFRWRDAPYDTQSGFKLFRNCTVFNDVFSQRFITKWFIDLEIFSRLMNAQGKLKIWEEPVSHWQDIPDSRISGIKKWSILKEAIYVHSLITKASNLKGQNGFN
jgi:glycosyltransferase involved in cell wall biosynthesis